jgi:hypothetical protein
VTTSPSLTKYAISHGSLFTITCQEENGEKKQKRDEKDERMAREERRMKQEERKYN